MNYNQNYEYEEEIDLLKLIFFCMSKWKSIIACALAGAILGGALAMFKAEPALVAAPIEKEELSEIAQMVVAMQERNAELAENQLDKVTEKINNTKLMGVNPYEMYKGKVNLVVPVNEKNLSYIYTALNLYITDELYADIEKEIEYSLDDLSHLVFSTVNEQIDSLENKSIANITVYGKTEAEASALISIVKEAVDAYLITFTDEYYIPEYNFVESNIIVAENSNIVQYQKDLYSALTAAVAAKDEAFKAIQKEEPVVVVQEETSNTKNLVLYTVIGAFLGGVASAGVWFVVFFAGGKLYAVADIERKFRTKVLGTVAVCDKKNPIDKWLFNKMNGLYSQFDKAEQEKIVLLNIKNELKKNEEIKKVMLVSSLGESISEAAQFIKTGLEEAGYTVSNCVNVIGRPDVMESAAEYDAAIVVENTTKSSTKLVAEENDVIKEYMNNGLYMVMV